MIKHVHLLEIDQGTYLPFISIDLAKKAKKLFEKYGYTPAIHTGTVINNLAGVEKALMKGLEKDGIPLDI